jgi:hypothetical protein
MELWKLTFLESRGHKLLFSLHSLVTKELEKNKVVIFSTFQVQGPHESIHGHPRGPHIKEGSIREIFLYMTDTFINFYL